MSPVPRKMSNEDNDLIKEFLDNGGTVDKNHTVSVQKKLNSLEDLSQKA